MTARRKPTCSKCYKVEHEKAFPDFPTQPGRWRNADIFKGKRGGLIAICKNCGHRWRPALKSVLYRLGPEGCAALPALQETQLISFN